MDGLRFERDPIESPAVRELIADHLRLMRSQSPACSVHALEVDALRSPDVDFWSVWIGQKLVGCGALKQLSPTEGEIKSMHVRDAHRGAGLGARILAHLEAEARARGYERLSLETGSQPAFEAARRMYRRHGYTDCPPFADYTEDPSSTYLTKSL